MYSKILKLYIYKTCNNYTFIRFTRPPPSRALLGDFPFSSFPLSAALKLLTVNCACNPATRSHTPISK